MYLSDDQFTVGSRKQSVFFPKKNRPVTRWYFEINGCLVECVRVKKRHIIDALIKKETSNF